MVLEEYFSAIVGRINLEPYEVARRAESLVFATRTNRSVRCREGSDAELVYTEFLQLPRSARDGSVLLHCTRLSIRY